MTGPDLEDRGRGLGWALTEGAAVVFAPAVLYYLLRLRAMAPVQGPDPAMHTSYIIQPRSMTLRYAALLAPSGGLREAARVGFLVPARIAYLVFGAVPGFFVTRYAFALIAVVPVYLLLRRIYGPGAGAVGIVVIMSSPIVVTAWGTDYPDSAVVSYLAGAIACLAMPCADRWRRAWIAGAAVLLTLAVWAHGVGVVLAMATLASYGVVRLIRDRRKLVSDVALVAGVAVAVTAGLSLASGVLLGNFDFILPTLRAYRVLSRPRQVARWHSRNWRWLLYVPYLVVPPAVLGAFLATFARRRTTGRMPTAQLIVGAVMAGQVAAMAYLQFVGTVQTLELYLFSSMLWGSVCVGLAVAIAELSKPLLDHRWGQWLPGLALLVVALSYEADPHVPTFGWLPYGLLLGALAVAIAVAARSLRRVRHRAVQWTAAVATVVAIAGTALVLSVAGLPAHHLARGTVGQVEPTYATALGGRSTYLIDQYQVTTELPIFVGKATYQNEQLVTWLPRSEVPALREPRGFYRAGVNALEWGFPHLSPSERHMLASRRPAEVLLLGVTGQGFGTALRSLAPYKPTLLRRTVLSAGQYHVHAWLIYLNRFAPQRA